MNQKSLNMNKLYLIYSTQTGQPYLDEQGAVRAFINKPDAEEVQKGMEGTILEGPAFYEFDTLASMCYAAGAEGIRFRVGSEEETFPLEETHIKIEPYNHALCQNLAMLKQTKQKPYLEKFSFCDFIVPVKIKKEPEPDIVYGIVRHSIVDDVKPLYLAFSNLNEFLVWQSQVPGWEPLKTSYRGLRRICGKHGFMLNVSGNRLAVTPEMLAMIPSGAEEVD